jgi:hypothetical protein
MIESSPFRRSPRVGECLEAGDHIEQLRVELGLL